MLDLSAITVADAADRLLALPTIADKTFLISIGDRSVTGLIARDQMVGPWQVPVSNLGVTTTTLDSYTGEAMAMGERAPIASLNYGASARMAVAESIMNIMSAPIESLKRIKLSANWQMATAHPGEGWTLRSCRSDWYGALPWSLVFLSPLAKTLCPCKPDGRKMVKKRQ